MKSFLLTTLLCAFALTAHGADFTGNWYIDLRTKEERKKQVECGSASFELTQLSNNEIIGTHSFATKGCGRLNEAGLVKGVANGRSAILIVTSGRNNAQVKGKAVLKNGFLYWQVIEDISPDATAGNGLILSKGKLIKSKSQNREANALVTP